VEFARLQAEEPHFRGSPLVDIRCRFCAPARFGDVLEHRIAPPLFGGGRSFRVVHRFLLPDGTLAAEGEQVRIWGMAGPNGQGLAAVPVPEAIAVRLCGDPN
jgi:acyl-CoA thioesterase FadM